VLDVTSGTVGWCYFIEIECGGVSFSDLARGNKHNQKRQRKILAYRIGYGPIRYHVKIKAKANPFLPQYDDYFKNRTNWRVNLVKEC